MDDHEQLARVGEVLTTMMRIKSFMLREGQTEHQTECPRCGEILRARLAGGKKHIRMACDGDCGMSGLE
jgi:predicted RNA-binding Zn-ribbon protein involved in translation (DUF1610 family)